MTGEDFQLEELDGVNRSIINPQKSGTGFNRTKIQARQRAGETAGKTKLTSCVSADRSSIAPPRQGRITAVGAMIGLQLTLGEYLAIATAKPLIAFLVLVATLSALTVLYRLSVVRIEAVHLAVIAYLLGYLSVGYRLPSDSLVENSVTALRQICSVGDSYSSRCQVSVSGICHIEPKYISGDRLRIGATIQLGVKPHSREPILVNAVLEGADVPWVELGKFRKKTKFVADINLTPVLSGATWPEPFSRESYLLRNGYLFQGEVVAIRSVEQLSRAATNSTKFAERFLLAFNESRASALIASSSLGISGLIDSFTDELFKKTALSHLIVVSGYHVALVFNLAVYLVSPLVVLLLPYWRRFVGKLITNTLALGLVSSFLIVVELGVPSVRAGIAFLLCVLVGMSGRRASPARCFIAVYILTIMLYPGCFLECGTQLTFMAVAGLIAASKAVSDFSFEAGFVGRVKQLCLTSTVAHCFVALTTAPVLTLWFSKAVPLGVFYNLLCAVPFTALVILCGGAGMISWAAGVPGSVWLISQASKAIDTALKLLSYLESLADIYGVGQQEILFRESESWIELVLTYSTLLSAQIALPGLIMAVYLIVKRYKSRNLPNNTNCGTTSRGMNPGIELGF